MALTSKSSFNGHLMSSSATGIWKTLYKVLCVAHFLFFGYCKVALVHIEFYWLQLHDLGKAGLSVIILFAKSGFKVFSVYI